MRKITLQILVILAFAISLSAQEGKPVLIDEAVGDEGTEQTVARLDILINALSQRPDAKAIVRISTGNENCFLCRYRHGSWMYAWLKNTRKVTPEKYSIENCAENKAELITRFYLLTATAALPKCNKSLEIPKKSTLFETIHFFMKTINLCLLKILTLRRWIQPMGIIPLALCRRLKTF